VGRKVENRGGEGAESSFMCINAFYRVEDEQKDHHNLLNNACSVPNYASMGRDSGKLV